MTLIRGTPDIWITNHIVNQNLSKSLSFALVNYNRSKSLSFALVNYIRSKSLSFALVNYNRSKSCRKSDTSSRQFMTDRMNKFSNIFIIQIKFSPSTSASRTFLMTVLGAELNTVHYCTFYLII